MSTKHVVSVSVTYEYSDGTKTSMDFKETEEMSLKVEGATEVDYKRIDRPFDSEKLKGIVQHDPTGVERFQLNVTTYDRTKMFLETE